MHFGTNPPRGLWRRDLIPFDVGTNLAMEEIQSSILQIRSHSNFFFYIFSIKKIKKINVTLTNINLYYFLYKGQYDNLSITSIKTLFYNYHINQITHKFSKTLLSNPFIITSKSLKKNNTQFTLKSTQTQPLSLKPLHSSERSVKVSHLTFNNDFSLYLSLKH